MIHTSSLDCLPQVPSGITVLPPLISISTSLLLSMKVTEIHLKQDANVFICIFICLQGWLFTSAVMKLHMTPLNESFHKTLSHLFYDSNISRVYIFALAASLRNT